MPLITFQALERAASALQLCAGESPAVYWLYATFGWTKYDMEAVCHDIHGALWQLGM